jgi:cytoskeletal protein CcmA (bactofilin family)
MEEIEVDMLRTNEAALSGGSLLLENEGSGASNSSEDIDHTAALGGVVIKGEIHSKQDLTIDGQVIGIIDASGHRLTIGHNAQVQAEWVKANEVLVLGCLKGAVDATGKVYIRNGSELVGNVEAEGIVIEDGAYVQGSIATRRKKE